mgnify:FL=1
MKKIFKIIISGPRTSGKTTLLHLLDGDQNLVNYSHDKFLQLYDKLFVEDYREEYLADLIRKKSVIIKSRNLNKKKYLNIHILKRKLYEIGYSWLESESFYNEAPAHFSLKTFHKSKKHNFIFNFESFDKKIKNDIFKTSKKYFFFEEIVNIYFLSYLKNWKNKKKGKVKNIIFKSPNEIVSIENALYELVENKCIYVKRDILGLTKSRALDLNLRNKKNIAYYFERILFSKYIENTKKNYARIDNIKKKFKKKLYVTSLEKLVFETKNEMKKIIKFLNLKNKPDYFYPSYNGLKSEKDHINKINDDEIFIPKKLMNLFKLRAEGLSYYIENPDEFSLINLLKYLYIRVKNFF